jgi:hypothetical protein
VAPTIHLERDPRFQSELGVPNEDDLTVGPEGDYDVSDEAFRSELAAEADAEFGGEAELERGFAEAGRQLAEEQRRVDEGGNLPRLTNQEVAQALAPQPGPPLRYGAQTIVLDDRFSAGGQKTRFGAFLNRDEGGDYILDSGNYGVNPPEGGWSVETGYRPEGKDMAYWGRVRDNLVAIDQWMAQNNPRRSMRLQIDFEGGQMHIRNYDFPDGPPLATLPAR